MLHPRIPLNGITPGIYHANFEKRLNINLKNRLPKFL